MAYDENSFLQGIATGMAMKGVNFAQGSSSGGTGLIQGALKFGTAPIFAMPIIGTYSCPWTLNYTEVKYLQSSGHQYINTGYYFGPDSQIEVKAMNTNTSTASNWEQLTAARSSYHASSAVQVAYNTSSCWIAVDLGTAGVGGVTVAKNTIFNVTVTASEAVIDDTVLPITGTFSGTSSYPLWIFDDNNAGSHETYFVGRVYSYKIYDNGVLSKDLKPVMCNYDRTAGFIDTITGNFYANAGSGVFGYEKMDGTYVAPV